MRGHTEAVNALAISSNGQWLISGSQDKTLRIWDVDSRTTLGEPILGHTEWVTSIAVSPDSNLVASASGDNTVRLWDIATRRLVKTLEGHENVVVSVVFSVDGNNVISGSTDLSVRVWDTWTGEAFGQPLKGHSYWVREVAVSPDGQWFASASEDLTVRIWSMSTLSEVHVLEGHSHFVTSVAFSPDSTILISGSKDKTVRVWNVQTGEAIGVPSTGHTGEISSVAFSPDGKESASGSKDGTVRIRDTRACTDLALYRENEAKYSELSEEELRIQWNVSRASSTKNDGWIRDGEKLLCWVPLQYCHDIKVGSRLVIGENGIDAVRPEVDYRKVFRFSGTRWKDIYTVRDEGRARMK